jgi:predicted ABC-type exoprotein transport system permease subunit
MSNNIINGHRINALILLLIGAVIWWYALLLMTNPEHESPWPDKNQWIGLIIAVVIAFVSWVSKCFTIIPNG